MGLAGHAIMWRTIHLANFDPEKNLRLHHVINSFNWVTERSKERFLIAALQLAVTLKLSHFPSFKSYVGVSLRRLRSGDDLLRV